MDYPTLRAELTNDPLAIGYAGKTDQAAADLLNAVTQSVNRTSVPQVEIANALVNVDFPSTALLQAKWQFVYSQAYVNPNNPNMVGIIASIFANTTATWANLVALATRMVSRATVLALGGAPSALDVNRARAGLW